ncbi:MAG: M36 family metallopeptidase [Xanthomonadales bacterium]|nr:M36 family metallopeptidase [Xanthomonadales bacterium]
MTRTHCAGVRMTALATLALAPLATCLASQDDAAGGHADGPALTRGISWLPTPSVPKRVSEPVTTGLPVALLATLRADRPEALSGASALPVRHWRQWHEGVPVFGAGVAELLDGNGATRAATVVLADLSAAPSSGQAFVLDAQGAVAAALTAATGGTGSPTQPLRKLAEQGPWHRIELTPSAGFTAQQPARARPWWYATENGLVPAWQVELVGHDSARGSLVALSLWLAADDGRLLRRQSLLHDVRPQGRGQSCPPACPEAEFGYRVMADRRGVPYTDPYGRTSPHPEGQRSPWLPAQPAPSTLVYLRHARQGDGDPWLPANASSTVGNNVDAFFHGLRVEAGRFHPDLFASWGPAFNAGNGDFRAPLAGRGAFDYHYDVGAAPQDYFQVPGATATPVPAGSPQLRAKIVQSFYAANWLHDLFYDAGFDEAAGNMQHDNFGRGGLAGDRLLVHAGFPNTFAFVPGDGTSPAISLGLNTFSLGNRDVSGFDLGVLAHEWAHTMFARLTTMRYQGQQGALNEGTADFIGMFVGVQANQRHAAPGTGDFHGAYPVGAYWNREYDFPADPYPPAGSPGYPDHAHWHGIRRLPYSASMAINPLTFRHISADNPLPAGLPIFDWKLRSLTQHEIHTAGEIWASALWQCARNILAATPARGFDAAHRRFLASLVAGLKLFPVDATWTEARNAILVAVRTGGEDDYRRCRAGFAQRGLGAGAVSPPRMANDNRGVVEDFTDADPPGLQDG